MKYYIYDGATLKYLRAISMNKDHKAAYFCLYKAEAVHFNHRCQAEAAKTMLEPEYDSLIVLEMPL